MRGRGCRGQDHAQLHSPLDHDVEISYMVALNGPKLENEYARLNARLNLTVRHHCPVDSSLQAWMLSGEDARTTSMLKPMAYANPEAVDRIDRQPHEAKFCLALPVN